jgi:hypothetical protein
LSRRDLTELSGMGQGRKRRGQTLQLLEYRCGGKTAANIIVIEWDRANADHQ